MEGYSTMNIPAEAGYTRDEVLAAIGETVFRLSLAQLLWLKDGPKANRDLLVCLGITLDFRVVRQAEALLKALAEQFPGLELRIGGRYDAYGPNLKKGYDDQGGFFSAELIDGTVRVEDTPIA